MVLIMTKKKYILAIILLAGIVLMVWFFWSKKNSSEVTLLESTNLLAANLQFTERLEQPDANSINYYSGSALAQLTLNDNHVTESKLKTKDLPFEGVKSIREGGSLLAVKAFYDPQNSLLSLSLSSGKQLLVGDNWFLVDKISNKVTPLLNFTDKVVSDVIIDGSDVFYLTVQDQGKLSLSKLSKGFDSNETLVDAGDASTFLGVRGGVIVLRDLKGNLYKFKVADGISKIGEKTSEAIFDTSTGYLVSSLLGQDTVGDEGGVSITEGSKLQLHIENLESGDKQQISLTGSSFFVSNGVVVGVNNLRQPSVLSYYILSSKKNGVIVVDQSANNVRDQIKSIIVMKSDLSKIGVITNFNQLLLYQTPGRPAPKDYKLPLIKDNLGLYGFNYDVGGNIATIYYSPSGKSVVDGSISELKAGCKCDVNQVEKIWKPFANTPGL